MTHGKDTRKKENEGLWKEPELPLSDLRAKGDAPVNATEERAYDAHYSRFKDKLHLVGKMEPRADFLYPVIRTVAFSDMGSALDGAIEKYSATLKRTLENDSDKK